ncbi:MAG: carbohydrate ABC transporter permease [Candidatus Spyradocola sp.]|jgi:multiple sugar transport system permease protein
MPALQRVELKSKKGKLTYGLIWAILGLGIPVQIFPYVWILLSMFKANKEVRAIPPTFFPEVWHWENIPETFSKYHLEQNLLNSFLLCVGVILLQVTISTLAAFALSKLRPKGSKWVMTFFLGTMMINSQALAWPTYIMFTNFFGLRLIDNLWSLILSFSAWAWAIFILKSFFDGLPHDLLESARIDGASNSRILFSIVMPLSKPVYAVVILNTFMACYNQFIYPLILLPDSKNWTIMVRIFAIQGSSSATWNQIMVLLGCATLPVLLCYIFAQKYIVQGISMSGLKG